MAYTQGIMAFYVGMFFRQKHGVRRIKVDQDTLKL